MCKFEKITEGKYSCTVHKEGKAWKIPSNDFKGPACQVFLESPVFKETWLTACFAFRALSDWASLKKMTVQDGS